MNQSCARPCHASLQVVVDLVLQFGFKVLNGVMCRVIFSDVEIPIAIKSEDTEVLVASD